LPSVPKQLYRLPVLFFPHISPPHFPNRMIARTQISRKLSSISIAHLLHASQEPALTERFFE